MFCCRSRLYVRKSKIFRSKFICVQQHCKICTTNISVFIVCLVCSPPPIVPLDAVSNPEFNFSSVFEIGDEIAYNCTNPAFEIANNVAICQPDGTWIPSSFVCNQTGNYTAVQVLRLFYTHCMFLGNFKTGNLRCQN